MRISTLLLALQLKSLALNEAVLIKFTNAVCDNFNKSWITLNECRLRAINRNTTTFNFNGTFLYPANDIVTSMEVFKKANGYKPWLFNVTIDSCRFVRKAYNPFAIIIYNLFKKFSNINHTCPFVGPQIIKGFYPRPEVLRLPFPSGEYLLAMTWFLDRKRQFTTNLYFIVVEDV